MLCERQCYVLLALQPLDYIPMEYNVIIIIITDPYIFQKKGWVQKNNKIYYKIYININMYLFNSGEGKSKTCI